MVFPKMSKSYSLKPMNVLSYMEKGNFVKVTDVKENEMESILSY